MNSEEHHGSARSSPTPSFSSTQRQERESTLEARGRGQYSIISCQGQSRNLWDSFPNTCGTPAAHKPECSCRAPARGASNLEHLQGGPVTLRLPSSDLTSQDSWLKGEEVSISVSHIIAHLPRGHSYNEVIRTFPLVASPCSSAPSKQPHQQNFL